jgi:hypothetical protein
MPDVTTKNETPWETLRTDAAHQFALRCFDLKKSNPYSRPFLDDIIADLMTELWDHGFSQTEIKGAFEQAVAELPRYAAGEERRGK